ncbi:hypothetical protein FQR65_LT20883 [Abscondita terminalis]|nr:hypothetical protein FQR65_LT20883 [Abscondita terminalis]
MGSRDGRALSSPRDEGGRPNEAWVEPNSLDVTDSGSRIKALAEDLPRKSSAADMLVNNAEEPANLTAEFPDVTDEELQYGIERINYLSTQYRNLPAHHSVMIRDRTRLADTVNVSGETASL